ncbi:hypothetical protein [Prauserella muralis]|uniref:hypothetical protein n=1 Tax=Prauserella muralis TaxID=588067 RepID=UPI0011ACF47A|nr:hypothetical protein [Prauserella muralis]TWE22654.1 hypothetical protein FHX69_3904 [Prauserella muralis]
MLNPDNPVVRLCGEGMAAEAQGRPAEARTLFERAWQAATDDYEACVAAHYLARHQPTPEDTLHWNQVCLERADRVAGFHASLHATLARAHGGPTCARCACCCPPTTATWAPTPTRSGW